MPATTNVRIGHCSPDAPAVDVLVDGAAVVQDVKFGDVGDYLELAAGSHEIAICPSGKHDQPVLEKSLALEPDHEYSVLAIGELADLSTLVLNDDNTEKSNAGRLRFVHACPDAPAVDVAFDGARLFANQPFGKSSAYASIDAGSYEVQVMPAGQTEPVLTIPGVSIENGRTYTAFAIGKLADDSLDAVVTLDHAPMAKMA
ncbi:DUF4397 domain-containing protein [Haloarchaeobius sp. TZWWS8]|uniref:DUF4397 domain-containing protein n=1 Tax=Haloarchaeobius sp. TZWWS8 TaxID=3446121 RepID=UPI003EBAF641